MREEKKKILRTSSVLISEVPPEKLRYDSNTATNTPNLSAADSSQLDVKLMLSFGGKFPLNSVHSTTSTNSNLQENKLKSTRSVRNIERLTSWRRKSSLSSPKFVINQIFSKKKKTSHIVRFEPLSKQVLN